MSFTFFQYQSFAECVDLCLYCLPSVSMHLFYLANRSGERECVDCLCCAVLAWHLLLNAATVANECLLVRT